MTSTTREIGYEVRGDEIVVSPALRHIEALMLMGGRCTPPAQEWVFPNTRQVAAQLAKVFERSNPDTDIAPAPIATLDAEDHLRTATDLPEIPGRTKSWNHQRQAYWWALPKKAAYLAMGLGSGKSKVAVALAEGRNHRRILIVCPKAVVGGWPNQFATHGTTEPVVAALSKGTVAQRVAKAQQCLSLATSLGKSAVVVINYEAVPQVAMQAYLRKAGFDFVVLDEMHKIKAPTGLISKTLWRIFQRQPIHRLALSGTPLPHSPLDAFGQFRFLDDSIFGTAWTRFRLRYAQYGVPALPQMVTSYINQDELAAKMAPLMFRVGREVLDLPPAHHVIRTAELGAKGARLYKDLERDFYSEVEGGEVTAAMALVRILRLMQVAAGFVKSDDGTILEVDSAKRDALADVLDAMPTDEPVVVFARFTHDLDVIRQVAESQGRRYGEVSGRRNDLVDSQMPDNIDVLGAQIQAGGVGVTFVRAAVCIYYTVGHSLSDYVQSLARTHRPGQTRPVTYVHILAENTLDAKVYQALQSRQSVVDALLGTRSRGLFPMGDVEDEGVA